MKDNMSIYIDPETLDLDFDDAGIMRQTFGDETTAQAVRATLQVYKGEFPLDISHGTNYERIMGKKPHELEADEIPEVLREAIFQEEAVAQVDSLEFEPAKGRSLSVSFTGTLTNGGTISMEVNTNQ